MRLLIILFCIALSSGCWPIDLSQDVPGLVENGAILWYLGTPSKFMSNSEAAVQKAHDYWASTTGSNLKFQYMGATTEDWTNYTHNIICFASSCGYTFSTNQLGVALQNGKATCVLINEGMYFDPKVYYHVILHEIGHSLGLQHSSDSNALMYYAGGVGSKPYLTTDDRIHLISLYPDKAYTGPAPDSPDYQLPYDPTKPLPASVYASLYSGRIAVKSELYVSVKDVSPTWDFGDGTSATGNYISHTFRPAGVYTITGTFTDPAEYWQKYSGTTTVTVTNDGSTPINPGTASTIITHYQMKIRAICGQRNSFKLTCKSKVRTIGEVDISSTIIHPQSKISKNSFQITTTDDLSSIFSTEPVTIPIQVWANNRQLLIQYDAKLIYKKQKCGLVIKGW